MSCTPFPATPGEVAVLTVPEFMFDIEPEGNAFPSMERVCRTFMNDANRALVWWIRFSALQAWRARTDVIPRLRSGSLTLRGACGAAAAFPLNDCWEFESDDFCAAIETETLCDGADPTDD